MPVLRAEIGQRVFDRASALSHLLVEIVDRILLDAYAKGGIERHCRASSCLEAGALAVSQLGAAPGEGRTNTKQYQTIGRRG